MFGQKYALIVNGDIKTQSDSWDYTVREFNSYVA